MPLSTSGHLPESGAHPPPLLPGANRLQSVDLLRGLAIALMALDHARDFFGFTNFDPTNLAETTPGLFLTRWITHFCAPVFVFLAGVGVALSASKGKPRTRIARSLLIRGFWLILLEFTVVRAGWFLGLAADITYRLAYLQVIWVLGCSMIVLASLIFLPRWIMFALSLAIVLGHNAFDHVDPASLADGRLSALWKILHVEAAIHWGGAGDGHVLYVRYPLLPWPAVMALGYLFAPILALPPDRSRRACILLGAGLTLAFIILRAANVYADPRPWTPQSTLLPTILSFINTTKYPPSLCYLLMTLGPAIAVLPFLDRLPRGGALRTPVATFGAVPLFFYITHLYLLQLGGILFAYARYGPRILQWNAPPSDYYLGLAPVYGAWIAALVILYYPCRWFARRKQRRPAWWHPFL